MNSTINNTTVIIYQSELEYLSRYTLDYPNIETGGHLFGFWNEDGVPVITFVVGPGANAVHQYTCCQPDIEYFEKINDVLVNYHGLKHIGEWHSHHNLGLTHPSAPDADNVLRHLRTSGVSRFLLCISTCNDNEATTTPYLFLNSETDYKTAKWSVVNKTNSIRTMIERKEGILMPKTITAKYNITSVDFEGDLQLPEIIHRIETYWFSDRNNHPILKKIIDEIKEIGADSCRVFLDDNSHVFLEISEGQQKTKVFFPEEFPKSPPIVEIPQSADERLCEWTYNGDIYDSFITYYKSKKGYYGKH